MMKNGKHNLTKKLQVVKKIELAFKRLYLTNIFTNTHKNNKMNERL